ncbi:MAG: hypothetical protein CJD30_11255 [Sulfuricurvum sp. PD_MW2]|jgi:hypothetical protein|uniref:class I SAM-dependent methyltransferase n=1 Tax=Sulfuricurvum sp. PD_MW2 TaxID=2027917 RepID=UPI000C05D00D|nr:hypothetical protein [Sulfuricurvum sp. PD_MW2]PHM16501.1 MAG: hypothetical protein CJD30_11255 [Sulfuricurvum sp. PD_MW2]
MIKMFETTWFGINFNSFSELNSSKQANESFYDLFYQAFYKKFHSYDELPKAWKEQKSSLATFIHSHIKSKTSILSIGSGNGYIENELSKIYNGTITALEPSKTASLWLKSNPKVTLINGYFPDALHQNNQFKFAYMSYTDYVFDDTSYVNILKTIKNYPIDEFLLVGASMYDPSPKFCMKYFIRLVLIQLGFLKKQLWGYQRTLKEHTDIFQKAGYRNLQSGQLADGTYWIKATNE